MTVSIQFLLRGARAISSTRAFSIHEPPSTVGLTPTTPTSPRAPSNENEPARGETSGLSFIPPDKCGKVLVRCSNGRPYDDNGNMRRCGSFQYRSQDEPMGWRDDDALRVPIDCIFHNLRLLRVVSRRLWRRELDVDSCGFSIRPGRMIESLPVLKAARGRNHHNSCWFLLCATKANPQHDCEHCGASV